MSETRLDQIQREQLPWRRRNFPTWQPHHPVMGVVEELGEFIDCDECDGPCEADAIGDALIFMSDACNVFGWRMQDVFESARTVAATSARCSYSAKGSGSLLPTVLLSLCGQLMHAQLKIEQRVRGPAEKHAARIRELFVDALVVLMHYGKHDVEECAWETWLVVSQRDWVAERAAR